MSPHPVARESQGNWDLAKATLTTLSIFFSSAGCSRTPSTAELITNRPQSSPDNIIESAKKWVDKEVTIYAKPRLLTDTSFLDYESGKAGHLRLKLHLEYSLTEPDRDEPSSLRMVDEREIELYSGDHNLSSLSPAYVLPKETFVVSGRVVQSEERDDLHLKYMNSLPEPVVNDDRKTIRD